jgi:hypothetical protein
MPKTYKTAIGFLRHISYLARHQDMSDCKDWDKLTEEEQKFFYSILAGIQNDIGELNLLFAKRGFIDIEND